MHFDIYLIFSPKYIRLGNGREKTENVKISHYQTLLNYLAFEPPWIWVIKHGLCLSAFICDTYLQGNCLMLEVIECSQVDCIGLHVDVSNFSVASGLWIGLRSQQRVILWLQLCVYMLIFLYQSKVFVVVNWLSYHRMSCYSLELREVW